MQVWFEAIPAMLLVLVALSSSASASDEGRINFASVVALENPVPADWLEKGGIRYAFVYAGLPVERGPDQQPRIVAARKEAFEKLFKFYEGTAVKLLLTGTYCTQTPKGANAVDVAGRTMKLPCYRQDAFHEWMRQTIVDTAKVFSQFPAFGGFAFDDAPGGRVDCCYCEACKKAFKEKHGIEPPGFAPADGAAVIDDQDPRLLWDAFQREGDVRYFRTQSEACRSVSPKLLMVTIPSDSFFYGRQLNTTTPQPQTTPDHGARLVRIERFQVKYWHLFQSFPFPRLPEPGEAEFRPWATGCHVTDPSPKIILHHEGPIIETGGRFHLLSPAEVKRMAYTCLTEGAPGVCYWSSGSVLPLYGEGFEAMAEVHENVKRVETWLTRKKPWPARTALVYSTTTEVLEQPWRENTMERWRHLHAFEGAGYALLRSSVPHRILFDSELTDVALKDLDVLVLTGVRFLTRSVADRVEQAIAAGKLTVLTDRQSVTLKGATVLDYNPHLWYERQLKRYRQVRYLDAQWREAERALIPRIREKAQEPVRIVSDKAFGRPFVAEDGSLLLLLANWDLFEPATATIQVEATRREDSHRARRGATVS
ncbi:MAG: hypothetical protein FJ272_17065, partial [Planctomycetes bacterium]|nr:hypothetical protein [Planctomycetota bacterium]